MKNPPSVPVSRRSFLKTTSLASAAAVAFPAILRAQPGGQSPNNRLNVACIGVGGRGRAAVDGMKEENLVAFCDVDDARAAPTYEAFPDVPRFRDYREMFDQLGRQIDAVTISTPDHMHFPAAVAALQLGKHTFVEKPLTHTVWEARELAKLAAGKKGLATQMGNQGHANEGPRILKEWLAAGVLGEVRECHTWTNRPVWPQGAKVPDHSKFIPVKPDTLSWDLWLGVAADRPYDPAYLPFNWRGYWDFGTGALGDMGCHLLDGAYWALELDAPIRVEAISAKQTAVSGPVASTLVYHFPARGRQAPVKWTWYDGGLEPMLPDGLEPDARVSRSGSGTYIVGTRATVFATDYYESVRIIPEAKMKEMAPGLPPKTLPRIEGGHFAEWIRACKGGPEAGSNFAYAAKLTELCLLSNVAIRARRAIEWDAAAMKVTNLPYANEYLTKQYRPGWGV